VLSVSALFVPAAARVIDVVVDVFLFTHYGLYLPSPEQIPSDERVDGCPPIELMEDGNVVATWRGQPTRGSVQAHIGNSV
jgi:hypothetical protein